MKEIPSPLYFFMHAYTVLLVILFGNGVCSAQFFEPIGAKSLGMANASVTLSDNWSPFHNCAGLATLNELQIGLNYANQFRIKELNTAAFTVSKKLGKVGAGLSFSHFGYEIYNHQRIAFGVAHKIEWIQLGCQLNYFQIDIFDFEVSRTFAFEFGGIVEVILAKLFFGATVKNMNQAKIKNESFPVLFQAGLSYRIDKRFMLNVELEKNIYFKTEKKAGLEYALGKYFLIRSGITHSPTKQFFGFGFKNKNCAIDYAFFNHAKLGISQSVTLNFFLVKK